MKWLVLSIIVRILKITDKEKITGPNVETLNQRTKWCHGKFDYLQLDKKTMQNYSDISSMQNRLCGQDIPPPYISDSNVLIIEMKTNSDNITGRGFQLRWEAVSGEYRNNAFNSM